MRTKIYWLHQFENSAKLGIMGRPCGNEQIQDCYDTNLITIINNFAKC